MGALSRLRHAWNAFVDQEPETFRLKPFDTGVSYGVRPDRTRLHISNERSIVAAIYTRLAVDASGADIRHVLLDDHMRYKEDKKSGLNNCLTVEANIDQAPRFFKANMVLDLCDKGTIAIVPVDRSSGPTDGNTFDINSMRVGEIVQWYPRHVRIELYNDQTGRREQLTLPKDEVAIVENPFYPVMNELNSTLRRLIRKLGLLDSTDERANSGKLDMIIQLPYVVKSDTRRLQAQKRREEIEFQLRGSQYGIAYTDGTEKVIQLNRPAENNLFQQVQDLKEQLYSELGLTPEVMNGSADAAAMVNYRNRALEPILDAIVEEMHRKFLSKTARTQKQAITYFQDMFKFISPEVLAEIADKFTRNEIMTSNEFRQVLGLKPSTDPKADQLVNSNMPQEATGVPAPVVPAETVVEPEFNPLDGIAAAVDGVFKDLGVEV